MDKPKTKEQYLAQVQKHPLPAYEEINKAFELDAVEDKHVLRGVAKKIADVHEHYAGIIEDILQPEHTITSMQESAAFNDDEREKLVVLLKELMRTYRQYTLANLENTDQKYVDFILLAWDNWPARKEAIRTMLQAIAESWSRTEKIQAEIEYLG